MAGTSKKTSRDCPETRLRAHRAATASLGGIKLTPHPAQPRRVAAPRGAAALAVATRMGALGPIAHGPRTDHSLDHAANQLEQRLSGDLPGGAEH